MKTSWKSTILLSFLFVLLCNQFTSVQGWPISKSRPGDKKTPSPRPNKEHKNETDYIKSFSSILYKELEKNKAMAGLFSKPIDGDIVANLASDIVESLVTEAGLVDTYSAKNLIIDVLITVHPSKGLKAYCKALTNVAREILLSEQILKTDNYFALANIVNDIIEISASGLLKSRKDSELKKGIEAELEAELNADISTGLNIETRSGPGSLTASTAGLRTDIGSNVLDPRLNAANLVRRADQELLTSNLDANVDINSLLGVDENVDFARGTDLNSAVDLGASIDLSVSEEANLQFKAELTNRLLKDKTFRYVFSDDVPPNALKQITAAICQYISKAFAISRSFLLPLENSIANLSLNSTPCPELYSNILSEKLTNLFKSINLITKGTASLQATIAANAIISGISNFIRMSTIPGVGVTMSENPFNSYFSALNGLEKLPYIGVEAISPKLSPALKLTYSSMYSSQFAKTLFYHLATSRKFQEVFLQGAPTFLNKVIVKSLAEFVAEAFGSSNRKLFYDLYRKALLTSAVNLNCMNYAKALSLATARALFLGGYFLSGNINIQAVIAKNAIVRALTTKIIPTATQVALFPSVLSLPWITQLNGVSPSQILVKYGIDAALSVGKDAGAGLRLDESINTKINAGLGGARLNAGSRPGVNFNTGATVGLNGGLGAGIGVDAGLGAALGINTDLGANLGVNAGLRAGQAMGAGLGAGLGINTDLGANLDLNAGLRTGQAVGAGLVTGSDITSGIGAGIYSNFGLGAGIGAKTALNTGLDINAGLGTDIDLRTGLAGGLNANTGLRGGLGVNAGLRGGQGVNAGFGRGIDVNTGLETGINAGVGLGLGSYTGLGAGIDLNAGAGLGLDSYAGIGSGIDLNAGSKAGLDAYGGLGANVGLQAGLDLNDDLDIQLLGINKKTWQEHRSKRSTNDLPPELTDWDPKFDLDSNLDLNLGLFTKSKTNSGEKQQKTIFSDIEVDTAGSIGTSFETDLGIRNKDGLKIGGHSGLDVGVDANLNAGINEILGAETYAGLKTGVYGDLGRKSVVGIGETTNSVLGATDLSIGTNLGALTGFKDGINLGLQSSTNIQLSVLNVLPLILANKLYQSTTLCTSISIVGPLKIINLIAQAVASEFGFPIATLFLRSYEQYIVNAADNSFEITMVSLAKATTETLAGTGFLNSKFSISTANQLADAIVTKFSSLIATSLEAKEYAAQPQWTYLLGRGLVQPPLIPGYNTYK